MMIWWVQGYHGGDYESYCLLGYEAVYLGRSPQTFMKNVLLPSSGSNKPRNQNVSYINGTFTT
jgi:hypothetical protein